MITKRNFTLVWTVSSLVAPLAFADGVTRPAELFCNIRKESATLNCQYFNGQTKRPLTDQDIIDFVDRASVSAYLTVESRAEHERTLAIDPSYANFKSLADTIKSGSASEIARAKFDIFAEIEKRVIKISDDLDTSLSAQNFIKYDPSVTNDKYRRELEFVTGQTIQGIKSAATNCATEQQLATLASDNRALSTELTRIVNAMRSPTSCLGDQPFQVQPDGSMDLNEVKNLSLAFTDKCRKSIIPDDRMPASIKPVDLSGPSAHDSFMKEHNGQKEFADKAVSCDPDYISAPKVITAANLGAKALCYGVARCGQGEAREETPVVCEATLLGTKASCDQPETCLHSASAAVWTESASISAALKSENASNR